MSKRELKPYKTCGESRDKDDVMFHDDLCESCRLDKDIEREEQREATKKSS
jgi:hypothetical protein